MSPLKNIPLKKPSAYTLWKLASVTIVAAMLGAIIVSSYFIYTHVYRTMNDANTIIMLNSLSHVDTINVANFEKARTTIDTKKDAKKIPNIIRNVFVFVSSTPAHVSSTSSTAP